jgi:hypothetical protein
VTTVRESLAAWSRRQGLAATAEFQVARPSFVRAGA